MESDGTTIQPYVTTFMACLSVQEGSGGTYIKYLFISFIIFLISEIRIIRNLSDWTHFCVLYEVVQLKMSLHMLCLHNLKVD